MFNLFRMHYSRHIGWFDVLLQVVVLAWNLRRKVCGASCTKPKLQDKEENPPTFDDPKMRMEVESGRG